MQCRFKTRMERLIAKVTQFVSDWRDGAVSEFVCRGCSSIIRRLTLYWMPTQLRLEQAV